MKKRVPGALLNGITRVRGAPPPLLKIKVVMSKVVCSGLLSRTTVSGEGGACKRELELSVSRHSNVQLCLNRETKTSLLANFLADFEPIFSRLWADFAPEFFDKIKAGEFTLNNVLWTWIPKIRIIVRFLSGDLCPPERKLPKCGVSAFLQCLNFCPSSRETPEPPGDGNSDFFCLFCLLVVEGLFEGTCAHGIRWGRSKLEGKKCSKQWECWCWLSEKVHLRSAFCCSMAAALRSHRVLVRSFRKRNYFGERYFNHKGFSTADPLRHPLKCSQDAHKDAHWDAH